jgi:hypothetical protein
LQHYSQYLSYINSQDAPILMSGIKKMWDLYIIYIYYIYILYIQYNSATKKNDILSFAGKWIELENIILRKISQIQKAKSSMFSHMWNIDLIK